MKLIYLSSIALAEHAVYIYLSWIYFIIVVLFVEGSYQEY